MASHRWTRRGAAALASAAIATLGLAHAAQAASSYTITNFDKDGTSGVYLRNAADLGNVTRDAAHYVTYGTTVQVSCYAWGTSVAAVGNRVWHQVTVTSGPNSGRSGWVSDHWLNTPVKANQIPAGEPACSPTPAPAPGPAPAPAAPATYNAAAISWARSHLNQVYGTAAEQPASRHQWSGYCWTFVRDAFAGRVPGGLGSAQGGWNYYQARGMTHSGTAPAGSIAFWSYGSDGHAAVVVDSSGTTIGTWGTTSDRKPVASAAALRHNTLRYLGYVLP